MSGEEMEGGTVSVDLPPESVELLDDIAAARGTDRQTAVRELLAAHRIARGREDVDARLDRQREEYTELIEDVRERVIQVKRETDRKGDADRVAELADAVEAVEADVDELTATVEAVEADLEAGFDNFDDALGALKRTTDRIEDRMDTLAGVVVDLRDRADDGERPVDALKRSAAREGVREADCGNCGNEVDLGLLVAAECPHCERGFDGVDPASGFFGSATLRTADPAGSTAGADGADRGTGDDRSSADRDPGAGATPAGGDGS